jgi:diketogulonate reductase-like aldo/keto reductase
MTSTENVSVSVYSAKGCMASFQLLDGTSIPWVAWGNGTDQAKKDAIESGKLALESGLRHIDTAQLYENEEETGIATEQATVPRNEVYVTSKSESVTPYNQGSHRFTNAIPNSFWLASRGGKPSPPR